MVIECDEILAPNSGRKRAKLASHIPTKKPIFIPTGKASWDEVLGGGAVRPSTIMVHGPKGTGKTTSILSISLKLAERLGGYVLWGSAEMPEMLVRQYADRVGATSKDLSRLLISDDGSTESLLEDIEEFQPKIIVWDSIQRFTWRGELGETELQNVVHAAIRSTNAEKTITFLLSQVTKDNDFVGTSGVGHDVDVLIGLRRDGDLLRMSCDEKNRFAETPRGASEMFLKSR